MVGTARHGVAGLQFLVAVMEEGLWMVAVVLGAHLGEDQKMLVGVVVMQTRSHPVIGIIKVITACMKMIIVMVVRFLLAMIIVELEIELINPVALVEAEARVPGLWSTVV